jgi:hypothetical protein
MQQIKDKEESKEVLAGLHKKNFVEKLTKGKIDENELKIQRINDEVLSIKENLLKYTLNVEQLSSKEIIDLKVQKSKLLKSQDIVANKIKRIELNLNQQSIKSNQLKRLSTFFNNANEQKISQIESFHTKLSAILKRELQAAKEILDKQNELLQIEITSIDFKIADLIGHLDSPRYIVDRIYDLTIEETQLRTVNRFNKQRVSVETNLKSLREGLVVTIKNILSKIETEINTELIELNTNIHTSGKKIPRIVLGTSTYSYDHSGNTGTGKSYSDLIEFDLSILKLTQLPFIIHDSILFKNIEDPAVDKILRKYSSFSKQIFIALDGINRYDPESKIILEKANVLSLSESRKLFDRDWR